jgi:hypothetical protein
MTPDRKIGRMAFLAHAANCAFLFSKMGVLS